MSPRREPPLDETFVDCVIEELRDGEEVTVLAENPAHARQLRASLAKRGATAAMLKLLTITQRGDVG